MAILFALLSAFIYGCSDFIAGLGSRRGNASLIGMIAQFFSLIVTLLALNWFRGSSPAISTLAWGAVSGIGGGVGAVMLYRGLAVGRMSTVAPVSAIVSAVIPALVGTILGQSLSMLALIGIIVAVPAIGLVSWQSKDGNQSNSGLFHGVVAGAGFALLFIGLDRAGTVSGAWPLVPGQAVSVLIIIPFAWYSMGAKLPRPSLIRISSGPAIAAGTLGGAANLLFLAATGRGKLAIVAVITSLYPAVTILLARMVIGERWTRVQAIGLLATAAAIALISAG